MNLETLIGLEFHVQLRTKSKMFCRCANKTTDQPNTNICPICVGHPGTLPTINQKAVTMALKAALALNCQIEPNSHFERKNYFYPDLPKGYQISQSTAPFARNGKLIINYLAADGLAGRLDDEKQLKEIKILQLHLEEDSAKSLHHENQTTIDYNRGGCPLIEIVTAPHLATPSEAKTFAQELRLIMRQLEISHANLEKGQLRCDANISLRPVGETKLYPKTEIKNINSFRALERALAYEIKRQTVLWKENRAPSQNETRGWDDRQQITVSQRTKEVAMDYRYFPEPDLPPIAPPAKLIKKIQNLQPELSQAKRQRFMEMFDFPPEAAKILTASARLADYTEEIISELKNWLETLEGAEGSAEEIWHKHKKKLTGLVSSWLINKFLPLLEELNITFAKNKITAENFAEFIKLVYQARINSTNAQLILKEMARTGADPSHVLSDKNLEQDDSEKNLDEIIKNIIKKYPDQVEQYRQGKTTVLQYFIGLIMKETKGKANPAILKELLGKRLS